MTKTIRTNTMSKTDLAVAWSMIAGLAVLLVQYSHSLALPAHFA